MTAWAGAIEWATSAMPNGQLRILHVVATAVGGDWFYQQVTGLARLGHTIQVVLPGRGPLADNLLDAGIGVEIIPFQGRQLRHQPRVIVAELMLARLIRSFQPDVIHAHLLKAILSCRLAATGYPQALKVAQLPGTAHLRSRPLRLLDQWTLSRDDVVVGSCRAIAERYRAMGARSVAVSYYGCDVDRIDPLTPGSAFRREFGLADDTPTVGMVAHMYPTRLRAFQEIGVKGHEVLLAAIPIILQRTQGAHVFIVGDELAGTGEYRRALEEKAATVDGGSQVHFTGHRGDIATVLAGLDVVVSPSIEESASYAMVEALLMRKGVVASNVGGLPDTVLPGETGLLVPPRDPQALATAVTELLGNPAERQALGSRGRAHCLRLFDINTTVAQLAALYQDALSRKRTKTPA
jgi:glycosyltransferase involved in cell wall biosynthesis